MLDRNSYTSRCIQWVRLPLALMIVLGHSEAKFSGEDPSVWINGFICWGLLNIAVPAFFLISGFLFFAGRKNFGHRDYLATLKRRGRTLLLPYFLWILIGWGALEVLTSPIDIPPSRDLMDIFVANGWERTQRSLLGYQVTRWGFPEGNGVLWFVRDLFIMFLFTPIIWWLGRHTGRWLIGLLIICYFLQICLPGIFTDAIYFFSIGACLAIFNIDFVRICHRCAIPIIVLGLLCYIGYSLCVVKLDLNHVLTGPRVRLLASASALTGTAAIFAIAAKSLYPKSLGDDFRQSGLNRKILMLASATFFIYCSHELAPFGNMSNYIHSLIPSERWSSTLTFFIYNPLRILTILTAWWLFAQSGKLFSGRVADVGKNC